MSSTANLNLDYLVDSQSQKAVTVNEALDALDGVLGNLLAKTITDANYSLTTTEALDNLVYVISGTLTANRNIVVPNNKKLYIVRNATTGSHSLVVKTSAGTGITIAVSSTTYNLLYCDGTNVVAVGSSGGGSGTVTSVAATVPSFLTVSGSPITVSGTIAITATTGLTANSILATPDGTTGALSVRLLVAADIPNLAASKITTGALALARGGTGVDLSATGGSTFVLAQDASHVISARALIAADIPAIAASLITSGTLALARGGTNADLSTSGGTTFVLAQDASHAVSARALVAADIPALAASIITSGLLGLAHGGTNVDLSASGSTTAVLAQDASHVISARSLVAGDIPSLAASILTSGQVALARGGTGVDLSASGSSTAILAQDGSHVVSARSLVAADIPNLDTSKLTTGILAAARGGVAQIGTADKGYFISTDLRLNAMTTAANTLSTANQVRACQFKLDDYYTISKITITVSAAGAAGATVSAGIYDASGNLLIDSGAFDGTSATTQTKSITPVTLPPGVYYFAQSQSTITTLTAQSIVQPAALITMMNNQTIKKCGTCANAVVSGAMPPTLGTITATNYNMLLAVFEP